MKWNDFVYFPGLILELSGVIVLVAGSITGQSVLLIMGMGIICIGFAVHIARIIRQIHAGAGSPDPGIRVPGDVVVKKQADPAVLYQDHLVRLSEDSITFHQYSFPFFFIGSSGIFP